MVHDDASEKTEVFREVDLTTLRRLGARKGMSLVEIMVVIAIVLTLMSVLAIGVFSVFGQAQEDTTIITMSKVAQQVDIYYLRKKKVPNDLASLYSGGEEAPTDSWGGEFQLVVPGPNGMKYDIISLGADGQPGGSGSDADIKWSENK